MLSKIETLIHTRTHKARAWLRKWELQIAAALARGEFRIDANGNVILFEDRAMRGEYFFAPRPGSNELVFNHNLIVDQGIMKALGVMFYTDTKIASWYLTMFSGATTPGNTLTAANFATTLAEITSTTEGFSNVTRPVWTPSAPAANVISNQASKATFNVVATTSIEATGGALVSSDVRGGTSGTLWSAGLFDAPRELFNGEAFALGYQTSLVD